MCFESICIAMTGGNICDVELVEMVLANCTQPIESLGSVLQDSIFNVTLLQNVRRRIGLHYVSELIDTQHQILPNNKYNMRLNIKLM